MCQYPQFSIRKSFFVLLLLGSAVWSSMPTASADVTQTPSAVGTLRNSAGSAIGTVEVYTTNTNAFGFWLRLRVNGGDVLTVVPFESTGTEIRFWFLQYSLVGAGPDGVTGAAWVERYSGHVSMSLPGATPARISCTMFYQSQGAQNTRRIPIDQVYVVPVIVTFP